MDVPVEGHRQVEDWSCGPAALKILFSHYNHHVSEQALIDLSHSGPAGGTTHDGMVSAARQMGYKPLALSDASTSDIKALLEEGHPVIVDFQGRRGGHFAVIRGFHEGRFDIQDPRETGAERHSMDETMFDRRWYNITYPDRRRIDRWMMAVTP